MSLLETLLFYYLYCVGCLKKLILELINLPDQLTIQSKFKLIFKTA